MGRVGRAKGGSERGDGGWGPSRTFSRGEVGRDIGTAPSLAWALPLHRDNRTRSARRATPGRARHRNSRYSSQ